MKKKLLALLVSAAMVCSFAGCGNASGGAADNTSGNDAAANNAVENNTPADNAAQNDAQTEAAPAETTGDTYNIGICQLVQHDALDAATQGFKDALIEELGEDSVHFEEQNAQGDSNTCSTIVNSFVSSGVDLILANATPALQAAAA